jgi:ATP-dependent Clp protease ATP-binding subunit ClpA
MFSRYTEQARRAIFFARLEAAHRDEEFIRAKDILLGMTWEEDTRAASLGSLKSHAVALRASVGIPHLPITAFPYLRDKEIPLDDDSKKVLAYASMEADRDWEFWIDTDHLLRGILRFQNQGADALIKQGVTLEVIRTASVSDRRAHPPRSTPKWLSMKVLASRHKTIALLVVLTLSLIFLVKFMGPI